MKKLIFILTSFIMVLAANADVHDDFLSRRQALEHTQLFKVFNQKMNKDERSAMEFLYAYMPLPDMADYDGSFYLRNVRSSLQTRKEMKWGKKVSDLMWRHFVLPIRINNENMDMSREVFYKELKDRVKGMSMTEAALEVNHWCHEKVTYTPSDGRTSAPLATVCSAYGRCGEESTFTVAAMRSVGIPARQVYTPRWAHTDDNHAWVEVWVDGGWHFLGACEPEAVLDLGWFNAPASRGMLMHTKVFGKYEDKEEVMSRNNCFTEIDVTENYAPVAVATVKVVDKDGNAVSGAKVQYKIYNYAEFYTVATKYSDENGMSHLSAGKGDMLVWASKDGMFGLSKLSVGRDEIAEVKLNKTENFVGGFDIDIVPPAEHNNIPYQTEEQIANNKKRFAYEDSLRNAYVATFRKDGELIEASRGNHVAIGTFMEKYPDKKAEMLLRSISAKDLRDCPLPVLEDHYTNTGSVNDMDDARYYMSPRISNEMLTPFRSALMNKKELLAYKDDAEGLAEWVRKNIKTDESWNPQHLCMSPKSVFELRLTDAHSRDIFYVAAARTLGMKARLDEVTGKVQYMKNGEWQDVSFSHDADRAQNTGAGTLKAVYEKSAHIDNPKYYSHFSISKIVDAQPRLMNYPEENCDWQSLLKNGEKLDEGSYLVVTGTRQANGSVLAHLEFVPVFNGSTTEMNLVMRENKGGVQVIGSFNSENLYNDDTEGVKSLLSTTGRGYYVIGLVSPNQEPTNHALRDIAARRQELEKWGRKIVLLFKDEEEKARFTNKQEFVGMPNTVVWGTDVDGKINKEIEEAMKLASKDRPVFLIADTFNRVVFMSQGYTIGLGEQLISVIKKLENEQ
jgi:hypothetical protein